MGKTLGQLQEEHGEMLSTAYDIGLEIPEALKVDFADEVAGATINAALDALIREHAAPEKKASPIVKEKAPPTKAAPKKEEAPPKVKAAPKKAPVKKKAAPKKAPAKKKAAKKKSKKSASEITITETKTVTKKVVKKAATRAPKTAAKNMLPKMGAFAADAKITWLGESNPCRGARFERIENLRKHSGKTYGKYRASNETNPHFGWDSTIRFCLAKGLVSVA